MAIVKQVGRECIHRPSPGMRQAIVKITPASFGAPCQKVITAVFDYSGGTFCIEPPPRKYTLAVIADVLFPSKPGERGWRELTDVEKLVAKTWPNGWTRKDIESYFPCPDGCGELLTRLSWRVPVYGSMAKSLSTCLHPHEDRLLSVQEIGKLDGEHLVEAWLQEQVEYCQDNAWGEQDWESSWDDEDEAWVGGETPDKLVKTFNLTSWRGSFYDSESYEQISNRRVPMDKCRRRVPTDWE